MGNIGQFCPHAAARARDDAGAQSASVTYKTVVFSVKTAQGALCAAAWAQNYSFSDFDFPLSILVLAGLSRAAWACSRGCKTTSGFLVGTLLRRDVLGRNALGNVGGSPQKVPELDFSIVVSGSGRPLARRASVQPWLWHPYNVVGTLPLRARSAATRSAGAEAAPQICRERARL